MLTPSLPALTVIPTSIIHLFHKNNSPCMINHLSYPHIVDLVFAYAPAESLAVMAKVCKAWRARALSNTSLVYNLLNDTYLYPYPISFNEAARHCRVLDIAVGNPATDNHLIPEVARLQTLAPKLDTIRLRRAAYADKSMWLPNARRIVFGAFHPDHRSLMGFKRGSRNGGWKPMEKLVINHQPLVWTCCKHKLMWTEDADEDEESMKEQATLFPQLKQVVLILSDEACASCIRSLLDEAQAVSVPVTVVGDLPSSSFEVRGTALIELTTDGEHIREGVEVLTHGEYRAEVGEREYAIEANWEQTPLLRGLNVADGYFPPLRRVGERASKRLRLDPKIE